MRWAITLIFLLCFSVNIYAQQKSYPSYYIPYQIYDTQAKQWISLETLLANTTKGDVLFIGELHDDTYGHQLELAIVEGASRRRTNLVIAMEMFERDAQIALDDYLAGKITELEFLSRARPWSNYQEDYRPIIEFARRNSFPVIGSNAPQRLARTVANNGMTIVEKFSPDDRPLVAANLEYPKDNYWERFLRTMTGMMGHGNGASEESKSSNPHANPHGDSNAAQTNINDRIEKFYQAQVLKDETMGESIANIFKNSGPSKPFVIHINGDFHSAFGEGTMARARRRMPEAQIKNITMIRVENLDKINVVDYLQQGDYLLFTLGDGKD